MTKAVFCRKAINIQDIIAASEYGADRGTSFEVRKVIELKPVQFHDFGKELYEYYRFLYDLKSEMFYDGKKQNFQCILVTTPNREEGILIQAEGYAYARYSAFVPDCQKVDLSQAETVRDATLSHEIPGSYWKCNMHADHGKERQEER